MTPAEAAKKEQVRKLELTSQKGQRVKQIYDDPVIVEIFAEMRETLVHNLETSPWANKEEREEEYRMLKTLAAFKSRFERRISDGKTAESRLSQLINNVRGMFA